MRTTSPRIVLPFLMAMLVCRIAYAQTDLPAAFDESRRHERYVIQPAAEALLGDMLALGETLPGGCTLSDGKIDRTSVFATYACGDAKIVLHLVHPADAPSSAVRTQRFAITVQSGTPPAGLVDAVAERIRAHEAAFEWTEVATPATITDQAHRRWPLAVAGMVVAIFAFFALQRRGANRNPPD